MSEILLNQTDVMPIKVVKTLLKVVVAQGHDVNEVIRTVGLEHNPLDNDSNDSQVVPTLTYSKLYKHVMSLLQDESFGLSSFSKYPPGTFRMMCRFIIHCQNLNDAILRAAEFFDFLDLFNQKFIIERKPVSFDVNNTIAICRFHNPNTPQRSHYLQSEASVIYMMHRFYGWLIGKSIPLLGVHFASPPPQDVHKYDELFDCDIHFDHSENIILFSADYLQCPIAQTEDTLRDFLRTAPYQLVTKSADIDLQSTKTRVRLMLEKDMRSDFPGIETIAERMNISSRTLHRRLRKENTSFQKIKDNIRRDAALAYMSRTELTINAVSVLMGFQDTSAFYRAFKKWTGMSPGDYRKTQLPEQSAPDA